VHGVKGIHQAHIAAARKSFTKMFWVVDGDAQIVPSFSFDYQAPEWDLETVHVWRSKNLYQQPRIRIRRSEITPT